MRLTSYFVVAGDLATCMNAVPAIARSTQILLRAYAKCIAGKACGLWDAALRVTSRSDCFSCIRTSMMCKKLCVVE
jgi:hypothetical protein